MREETEQEKRLRLQVEQLERDNLYFIRVLDVLVAVGAVKEAAVDKAKEIVSSFN